MYRIYCPSHHSAPPAYKNPLIHKASVVAVCGKEAIAKGVKAGNLVKEIAKLANGGGGGRPDSAMAGAKDVSKLDDALAAAKGIIESFVK